MDNAKLAKSTGNTAYLSDLVARDIHPLSLRYWFLTAHYRQPANFTWEAVEAAQKAYLRLREKYTTVKSEKHDTAPGVFIRKFTTCVNNDLDTPGAIASIWEYLNAAKPSPSEMRSVLEIANTVLGLNLGVTDDVLDGLAHKQDEISADALPDNIKEILLKRDEARDARDWKKADELRVLLEDAGFMAKDTAHGTIVIRK